MRIDIQQYIILFSLCIQHINLFSFLLVQVNINMELLNNNKSKKKRYQISKKYIDTSLQESVRQSNQKIKQILQFGYHKQQWQAQQKKSLNKNSERICLPKLLSPFLHSQRQIKQQNNNANLQGIKPNYKLEQLKRHRHNRSVFSLDFDREINSQQQPQKYRKQEQNNNQKVKKYSRQLKLQHLHKFREKEQMRLNKSLCEALSQQNNIQNTFNDLDVHNSLLKMQSRNDSVIKMEYNAKKCKQIYQKKSKSLQSKNILKNQLSNSQKLIKQYHSQISVKIGEKYRKNKYKNISNEGEFSYLLNHLKQKSQQKQIIDRERLRRISENGRNTKKFMRYQQIEKQYQKNKSLQKSVLIGVETNLVSTKKKFVQSKRMKTLESQVKHKLKNYNCSCNSSEKQSKKPSLNNIKVVGKGQDRENIKNIKKYLIILDNRKYKANHNSAISQNTNKAKQNSSETKKMLLETRLLCSPWQGHQHQQKLIILDSSFEQNDQTNQNI